MVTADADSKRRRSGRLGAVIQAVSEDECATLALKEESWRLEESMWDVCLLVDNREFGYTRTSWTIMLLIGNAFIQV